MVLAMTSDETSNVCEEGTLRHELEEGDVLITD